MTPAQIDALTTDQLVQLDSADLRALTTEQLAGFSSSHDIAAFTTDQFQAFTTSQLAALTTTQIQWIETNDIAALTTDQVLGLTTVQMPAFTTDQIVAFDTDDFKALSDTQVAALTEVQISAISMAGKADALFVSPIILDLDGNGVSTTAVDQGVEFDVLAVGSTQRVGWVAPSDGLLVRDLNGDGLINDGRELFGVGTQLPDGTRAGHGFAALAALDSNGDGRISAADEAFDELQLWVDVDQDAQTDAGELRGLIDLGITELDLDFSVSDRMDNGNLVGLVSGYRTQDGQTHEMADVWFRRSREAEPPPALGELLASPPTTFEPQPQAAGGTSTPPDPQVAAGPVLPGNEDELRQVGPLI